MASLLCKAEVQATYSYAGVTNCPRQVDLPTRVGGFGGVAGLCQYLRAHGVTHVIDATHPFAAQMSQHAIAACQATGVALLSLERKAWQPLAGDTWIDVPDMAAAAAALPSQPSRVFLAIGRKQLAPFAAHAQHHYVLRVIDSPEGLPLQNPTCLVARGPFRLGDELALLRQHGIQCIVSKNAGGSDTYAKIEAARQLGLPVIMVRRPALPPRMQCESPQEAMHWLNAQG